MVSNRGCDLSQLGDLTIWFHSINHIVKVTKINLKILFEVKGSVPFHEAVLCNRSTIYFGYVFASLYYITTKMVKAVSIRVRLGGNYLSRNSVSKARHYEVLSLGTNAVFPSYATVRDYDNDWGVVTQKIAPDFHDVEEVEVAFGFRTNCNTKNELDINSISLNGESVALISIDHSFWFVVHVIYFNYLYEIAFIVHSNLYVEETKEITNRLLDWCVDPF